MVEGVCTAKDGLPIKLVRFKEERKWRETETQSVTGRPFPYPELNVCTHTQSPRICNAQTCAHTRIHKCSLNGADIQN